MSDKEKDEQPKVSDEIAPQKPEIVVPAMTGTAAVKKRIGIPGQ